MMREVSIRAVKSKIITPKENLFTVLEQCLKKGDLKNGDILAVASKAVAVAQGRVVNIATEKEYKALVELEADQVIGGKPVTLTLKNGIFTPWAGIDRSNTQKGTVVLWPKNPQKTADEIRSWLKRRLKLSKVGVVVVDSFCVPLRRGVIGVALANSGFRGVNDLRGGKDLYGNTLRFTQEAVADSLATMANCVMGQGKEQTPFAIIRNAPVIFTDKKTTPGALVMTPEDCLYRPLYKKLRTRKS